MIDPASSSRSRRLYRNRHDAMLMGVCSGIADYYDFKPGGVRLLFVLLCFPLGAVVLPLYIVLGFTMKPPPDFAPDARGGASGRGSGSAETLRQTYRYSRVEALREVQRRFDKLEQRLQRMESIVTDPAFNLEEEYRRL